MSITGKDCTMKALGLIETCGLLAAIEGADAMLKAADVRLVEKSLVGAGLVTITVTGEVSAVQAAVEAGAASIGRIDGARLISRHVIARPDVEVAAVVRLVPCDEQAETQETEEDFVAEPDPSVSTLTESTPPVLEAAQHVPHTPAQLKKMSVGQLRHLARHLNALDDAALSAAGKKALMDAIIEAYRHREE